ncbi:MAG: hypothetical protein Q7S68_05940 [Deltaproteobacteria bacterium]|nr:hypothetical protein [Deltaproteobacteria bacterium]
MKTRIILFLLLLFSQPLLAQTYNAILQHQPQFVFECVNNCEVRQVHNSGIGDGITTTGSAPTIGGQALSQSTFFCGPDDEENVFLANTGGGTQNGLDSLGSYRFVKIRDRWREQRDGKAFYLGTPLLATNCARAGQKGVLSFDRWRPLSTATVRGDTPVLRGVVKQSFQRRNFLEDSADFRYGRYLFKFMPADTFDPNAFGLVADPASFSSANNVYGGFFYEPTYFDCPYGRQQQRVGFLCGEMAGAQAYNDLNLPSANVSPLIPNAPIHPQQWNFYRDLLQQAVDLIGVRIDQNYWGRVRPRMGGQGAWQENEREMSGIVVTIWEILKQMRGRMPTGPFGGAYERIAERVRGVSNIEGQCAATPTDTLVALDRTGSRPKLVFRKDLCIDTQAKRTLSHPHFNVVADTSQPGISTTAPSYGNLSGGGIYDNLFTPNRGYRWVVSGSGATAQMQANPVDGKVASYGYGGLVVSMMAHQLCHLFYREQNIAFQLNSLQAGSEEELCVMAQALVYQILSNLGHIRSTAIMTTEEYNPDSNPNAVNPNEDGFVGKRFYYRDEWKAMNNIVVAPLHEDMMGIAHNLKRRDHEMARMEAHLVSMCPFFTEPENASINGVVARNPYYVAPPVSSPPQQPSQPSGVTVQTPATSPGGQIQQGVNNLTINGVPPPTPSGQGGGSINVNQPPKSGATPKPATQSAPTIINNTNKGSKK